MGSFSWRRADTLGLRDNICYGDPFKMLIPKEFGGGFIKDKYQDYGRITDHNTGKTYDMYELLAFWNHEKIVPKPVFFAGKTIYKKFAIGETAKLQLNEKDGWTDEIMQHNGKQFLITGHARPSKKMQGKLFYLAAPLDGIAFEQKHFDQETEYQKGPTMGLLYKGDTLPMLKPEDKDSTHNRSLGIDIGCSDEDKDLLKYPLKLVSVGYTGTYEDCPRPSYSDPYQGLCPVRR